MGLRWRRRAGVAALDTRLVDDSKTVDDDGALRRSSRHPEPGRRWMGGSPSGALRASASTLQTVHGAARYPLGMPVPLPSHGHPLPAVGPVQDRLARILGTIMLACGAVLLLVATVAFVRMAAWLGGTEAATGVVIAHRMPDPSTDSRSLRGPRSPRVPRASAVAEVVRFTDGTGVAHEFRSSFATSSPLAVGQAVAVRFRTDDPADAVIDGWFPLWGFPGIPAVVGAVFLVAGAAFRRGGSRRRRLGA